MKHLKGFVVIAVLLVAGSVVGAMFTTPVLAQVRAALVRDVDTPSLSPFRAGLSFGFTSINEQRLLTTVPAGKRLVIEHVSYWGYLPTGKSFVFAALRTGQVGPLAVILEIHPPHESATPEFTIQDGSFPVKAYFDAGDEVWISASKNGGAGGNFEVRVQGHLITP